MDRLVAEVRAHGMPSHQELPCSQAHSPDGSEIANVRRLREPVEGQLLVALGTGAGTATVQMPACADVPPEFTQRLGRPAGLGARRVVLVLSPRSLARTTVALGVRFEAIQAP
jgi:hypothetical protein